MAGQVIRKSTRCLSFSLGIVVAFSGSLLFLMDGVCLAQAGESVARESAAQGMDMDGHAHGEGADDMMVPHQKQLGPHMKWTVLRPANAEDAVRADQIVQTLRQALAKYKDYQVALNDGYAPRLHSKRKPNQNQKRKPNQKHYHFTDTNKQRRTLAKIRFEPAEPTALLYKKAGDGYEFEGAMYTAPKDTSEDQLNERVPLSVVQWHAHVNRCLQPDGSKRKMTREQFGGKGRIATESECQQVGGRFLPQGAWMFHVYPFESTPVKIWTH